MSLGFYIDRNHMLQGPGVIHALINPEATSQPKIKPRTQILHSQSGPSRTPWDRLVAFMRRSDITLECHFLVNLDGTVVQCMPTNVRADCNYKANPFAISYETQDNGYPANEKEPWTPAQAEALANVVAAVGHKYGIPYTSPANYLDAGVGYHSQFPEWSVYKGKTCPGAARIRQMDWVRRRAAEVCACAPSASA